MCSLQEISMLVRFGKKSSENLGKLTAAYDAVMEDVLAGKGAQVVSASTNGASFTFAQGGGAMTNTAWATCLDQVLRHVENSSSPSNFAIAKIC